MSTYFRCSISLFLLLCLYCHQVAFAQTAVQTTSIQGKVLDENLQPAVAATVRLMRYPDSATVSNTLTDTSGYFEFKSIKTGDYFIAISKVGYSSFFSLQYHVGNGASTIKTADVKLVPLNFQIKEVTITAKRDYIEVRPDKTVINVEKSIVAAGNNMLEVLRNAPGVKVSGDEVMYKGGQKALIAVNGKVTQFSGEQLAELLKSYPSSAVSSVELIDNPPAKYDAAGGGLINIVLKKDKNQGLRVVLSETAAAGQNYRLNSSANINYRSGGLNIFGTYTFTASEIKRFWDVDRYLQRGAIYNEFDMRYRATNSAKNHAFNTGADLALSKNQTIGMLFYGYANLSGIDKNNTTNVYTNAVQDSAISTQSAIDRDVYNLNYNLNYSGSFGKSTLTADWDYSTYRRHSAERLANYFFINQGADRDPLHYYIVSPADIDVSSVKVDYLLALKPKSSLSMGFKNSNVQADNKIDFNEMNDGGTQLIPSLTNRFKYHEWISAGYISYKGQFKKLSVVAGLRAEKTEITRQAYNPSQEADSSYFNLFPSLQLSQQLSEAHLLSLSYGRRISRPNYQDLNPFIAYIDPYAYSTGNPYLRPQYTHAFQLADVFKIKYKAALNFNIVDGFFTTIYQQNDTTGGYNTIKRNIGKRYSYGLEFSAPVDVTNWWSIDSFFSLSHDHYVYGTANAGTSDAYDFYTQIVQSFSIGQFYRAEFSGTYDTPTYYGIKSYREQYYFSAGVSRSLFNKQGSLKLAVSDIFNTQIERYSSRYLNLNLTGREKPGTRFVSATFTYRFGNTALKAARRHSGGSKDEVSRLSE